MNEKSRQLVEELSKIVKKDKYAVYAAVYVFWIMKKIMKKREIKEGEAFQLIDFIETLKNAPEVCANSRLFIYNKLSQEDWAKYCSKICLEDLDDLDDQDDLEPILMEPMVYLGIPSPLPVSKPRELMELIASILDIQNTDIVVDMQVGSFFQHLLQQGLGKQCLGFGMDEYSLGFKWEENYCPIIVAKIQDHIIRYNYKGKEQCVFGSFLEKARDKKEKYNKIFSGVYLIDPLYNLPNNMGDLDKFSSGINKGGGADYIFTCLMAALENLDENGKAVFLLTASFLKNQKEKEIRKKLFFKRNIETIISFESKNSKESQTTLIIVVLTKKNCQSIRMIDASEIENYDEIAKIYHGDGNSEIERFVEKNEFKLQDWVMTPDRYLQRLYGKEDTVQFEKVIKASKRGLAVQRDVLEAMKSKEPTDYCYLALADIERGVINDYSYFLRDASGIERMKNFVIEDNDIIFTKNKPYKVVVGFEMKRKCIASGNMLVIKLDETKVNPFFLKAFFDSNYGQELLNEAATASNTPSLSQEALNKLLIWLPPLDRQQAIGEEYKVKLRAVKKLLNETSQAMEDLNGWMQEFNKKEMK